MKQLYFLARANFILVILLITLTNCIGQVDTLRHQFSIGVWPQYIKDPFLSLEYKHFLKRHKYYGISIEGLYRNKNEVADDFYRFDIALPISLGIYFPFLKYFRVNTAAQITPFVSRLEGTKTPEMYYYNWYREGIFFGPEIGLESTPINLKTSKISFFAKMHFGYGWMHERSKSENTKFPYDNETNYNNWIGSIIVGLGYRF